MTDTVAQTTISSNMLSSRSSMVVMAQDVETLFAELFEAAGVGRRWGEQMASQQGQTQARWQTLWIAATGTFSVPQIARRLGVARQGVQRIVSELADEGLVTFAPNPDHKASPLILLTTLGHTTLNNINQTADDQHQQLLKDFPVSDIASLRTLLQRFTATVTNLEKPQSATAG